MSAKKSRAVILAAGDFPKKGGEAWETLANAPFVVCCDSAADFFRSKFKREPNVVIGDCDSVRGRFKNLVYIGEQETNDLEKAVRWCKENKIVKPIILGATGKREDHTIGNVFRALALGLEVLSDFGRFIPVENKAIFKVKKGDAISIFAPDPSTKMTSKGLEWSLDNVRFENLYCATLNRSSSTKVVLTTTKRVCVYFANSKD